MKYQLREQYMDKTLKDQEARLREAASTSLAAMNELLQRLHEHKLSMMRVLFDGAAASWPSVRLRDVLMKGDGIILPSPHQMLSGKASAGGLPVITGEAVETLRFLPERCRSAPGEFAAEREGRVRAMDIVMLRRGERAGACAIMPVFFAGGILSEECLCLRADPSRCEAFYLGNALHHYYRAGVLNTLRIGSKEREISLSLLEALELPLPPPGEQKRIAETLLAASSKIVECETIAEKIKELRDALVSEPAK